MEYCAQSGAWEHRAPPPDCWRGQAGIAPRHGMPYRGTRLEDDQVVPMDELGLGDIAQHRLDLGGGLAQDPGRFRRAVVDESAGDLAPIGTGDAYHLAALEASVD